MAKINALITADCILDEDIGLLKLVQFYYRNTDMFLDDILDNEFLEDQQYYEYTRFHPNPLSVIVKTDDLDKIDSMYEQFWDSESDRIIELSCNTDIIKVLSLVIQGDTPIHFTILCDREKEVEVLKRRLVQIGISGYTILLQPDHNKVDVSLYDDVYVKYIEQLDSFRNIMHKAIYVSTHYTNYISAFDDSLVLRLEVVKYSIHNTINTFSLYNFGELIITK